MVFLPPCTLLTLSPTDPIISLSSLFFSQLKSPTNSTLPSLLIILSKHLITSLCISLCSSVLGGTCNYDFPFFFNSSVLIVTPVTSTMPSPYYT
ncbi:hypothetical protein E2C01_053999 [Portunus trituberculatus]|uniref:Uncharacterized protein n=1 Tax=Portunus trituberculatus TaxID=210409 RepID=A0A5B7GQT5_PORTR|nr:hypothetical protein [Portunus trituberculatus]